MVISVIVKLRLIMELKIKKIKLTIFWTCETTALNHNRSD